MMLHHPTGTIQIEPAILRRFWICITHWKEWRDCVALSRVTNLFWDQYSRMRDTDGDLWVELKDRCDEQWARLWKIGGWDPMK